MPISDMPSEMPEERQPPEATPEMNPWLVEEPPDAAQRDEDGKVANSTPLDEVCEEDDSESTPTPPPEGAFPVEVNDCDSEVEAPAGPAHWPVAPIAEPTGEPLDGPEEVPEPPVEVVSNGEEPASDVTGADDPETSDVTVRTAPVEESAKVPQDAESEAESTPRDADTADERTSERAADEASDSAEAEEASEDAPAVRVEVESERDLPFPREVQAEREVLLESVTRQSLVNEIVHQIADLVGSSEAMEATGLDFFAVLIKSRLDPQWVTVKLIKLTVAGAAAGSGMPFPHLFGELAGTLAREFLPVESWKAATVRTVQIADIGLDARDGRLDSPISRAFVIEEAQRAGGSLTAPKKPRPPK
ncbi:hypothetical protein [Actinomadura monticuli]|uniref:Uncharacterized protein n=1 Tax=Actinomadura monticuli TaxID=3097367 RepID=A0ABV4QBR0_9ACTN